MTWRSAPSCSPSSTRWPWCMACPRSSSSEININWFVELFISVVLCFTTFCSCSQKLENAPSNDFDVVLSEAHTSISQHYNNNAAVTNLAPTTHAPSASVATPSSSVNLLDWDDNDHSAPQPVAHSPPVQHRLHLKEGAVIPPARFQQLWTALPESFSGRICHLTSVPSSGAELESRLRVEKVLLLFCCL